MLVVVGKSADEAPQLYREIKALENTGDWAVEVEVIPEEIATLEGPILIAAEKEILKFPNTRTLSVKLNTRPT